MSLPRVLILARHGQSEHHVRGLTGGWTDTPLTEVGHEQARRVAARLSDELDGAAIRLYSSDLLRAGETASHIARAFGVEPISEPLLREHNNGDAVNLTHDEARIRFPRAYEPGASLFGHHERLFSGAETGREFLQRAQAFLDSLPPDGPVPVVVTHGGTILCLVAAWLLLPPEAIAPIAFAAYTTSITVLTSRPFREIERLNDVAHLQGMPGYVAFREFAGRG